MKTTDGQQYELVDFSHMVHMNAMTVASNLDECRIVVVMGTSIEGHMKPLAFTSLNPEAGRRMAACLLAAANELEIKME